MKQNTILHWETARDMLILVRLADVSFNIIFPATLMMGHAEIPSFAAIVNFIVVIRTIVWYNAGSLYVQEGSEIRSIYVCVHFIYYKYTRIYIYRREREKESSEDRG